MIYLPIMQLNEVINISSCVHW